MRTNKLSPVNKLLEAFAEAYANDLKVRLGVDLLTKLLAEAREQTRLLKSIDNRLSKMNSRVMRI